MLEVTGDGYYDATPIWASQPFPSRVPVRPVVALDPEFGVPVLDLRDELTVFQNLTNPNRWSGPFRGSPARWKNVDGDAVLRALLQAEASPVPRPLGKLSKNPVPVAIEAVSTDRDVVVPELDEQAGSVDAEGTAHTEVQWLLLKLGPDMGFDVHVAKNDASRAWKGQKLGEMPKRRDQLPQQFDPATNRTIELIDLLWLQGNAIVAAFEIESTTSIY